MKYAIIENNKVVNVAVSGQPLAPNWIESNTAAIGDIYINGTFTKPEPIPPSPEELQKIIVESTQKRLDDFAQTRNYDGIMSACTYETSSVPKFRTEGQYCVEIRDTTWATLYNILAEIEAGTRPIPAGFNDIESDLPELIWPS